GPVFHTIVSIKNDGHYFCRAGGNRPDGLNEPVTLLSGTRIIPGTLSGIATTKNSKSKGNGAGGVGGNGLIFRYYRLTACG
ncbi:hypothetical protein, partial [Escherichia coli]|uniref:hypothetical protein n=2 Tax=Escherichia coli TaxID=562 RepID=UPI001F340392